MSTKKQSLETLSKIFEEEKRYKTDMFFRNSFANACHLSLIGEDDAAQKTLKSLFDWLGWDRSKTYFLAIKNSLKDYALDYAHEISANLEINEIFYKKERELSTETEQ